FAIGEPVSDEHSIEIPDRQAVVLDIEFRVIKDWQRVKRIGVGYQVATHPIRIDQLDHASFFERLFTHLIFGKEERIAIETPTHRRMRNPEVQENVLVEIVLADDELVYAREKCARLGALNDAMIVGAADRNRFADAELGDDFRRHRLIFSGKLDCTGSDDY